MIKKILYVLDKRQKNRMVILLFMILGGSFVELIGVSAILPLISVITDPSIIETNKKYALVKDFFNIPDAKTFVLMMALALVIIYIIKNVYLSCMYDVTYRFTYNNQRRVAMRLMECYMSQDYMFHVSHNVSELSRNVSTDVVNFFCVVSSILQLITEVLVCIVLIIFLMFTDFTSTLTLAILLSCFMFVVVFYLRKKLVIIGKQNRQESALMNKYFLQAFGGIKEIKVSNKERFFLSKYEESYRRYALNQQKQLLLGIIPRPIMETLCICGILVFMSARIYFGANMTKLVPVMSVFAVAAIRMLPSFSRISAYIGGISFNKSSVDAVYKDLCEIENMRVKFSKDESDTTNVTLNKGISISGVSFAYPSKPEKIILDNVSVQIASNKSIAIIGPSGAGKTTLADIILGVLKPQSGFVMADDININEHLHAWHKKIGYIPQNIFLTDDTVRRNVAFGIEDKEIDDNLVWKALEEAQLSDFIREQSTGLDAMIGDRGVKISGGQRQRIGIARALYTNPSLLVLDEATSALDNDTEKAVMSAIDNLSGTRTIIIIAHRLSTIKNCDMIYEVKEGKVVIKSKKDIFGE